MKIDTKVIRVMVVDDSKIKEGDRLYMNYNGRPVLSTVRRVYPNCFVGSNVNYPCCGTLDQVEKLFRFDSINKIYGIVEEEER